MSQKVSLKEAERKVFSTTFQDGLWDVFIGCFVLEFAIAPLLSRTLGDFWSSVVFLPFWGLVYLVIWLIRTHIVKPRLGEVKFGKTRKLRLIKFNIIMLSVNILALILGIIVAFNAFDLTKQAPSIIFGVVILISFSLAAFFLDFSRLYLYGLLTGLSPLIGEWLYNNWGAAHHGFPITFGVTSVFMILIGLFLFARFIINNPPIPAEAVQDDRSSK